MTERIYTTEQLVDSVRLRCRLPNVQIPGTTDDDIILTLNEEMKTRLLPALLKPQEEHFLKSKRYTVSGTTLRYRVPYRASGLKLRDAWWVDSNGNGRQLKQLTKSQVAPSDVGTNAPTGFRFEGPWMVLVPDSSGSSYAGTLELTFYMRPGDLVPSAEYRKVTAVVSTTEVTLDSDVPSSWSGSSLFDVHHPSSGGETKVWGRSVSTLSGTQVIFSEAIDGTVYGDVPVEVGDYFVLAGTAAVPALPVELHVPLVLAASSAITQSLDPQLSDRLKRDYEESLKFAAYTVDLRSESAPPTIRRSNPMYGR